MGRYIKEIRLGKPIDVVSMVMDDFFYHNKFTRTDWNGEMVFRLTDKHSKDWYFKWFYAGGVFHVEAWIKNRFGTESSISSLFSGVSKIEFRRQIDHLIRELKMKNDEMIRGGHIGSDPVHHDEEANHQSWKEDTKWQDLSEYEDNFYEMNTYEADSYEREIYEVETMQPQETYDLNTTEEVKQKTLSTILGEEQIGADQTSKSKKNQALWYAIIALLFGSQFFFFSLIFVGMALKKGKESKYVNLIRWLCYIAIFEMVCGIIASFVK